MYVCMCVCVCDPSKTKNKRVVVRSRFLSRQNYYWENVSPICPVRTFTYTPATGFELILWTCHICFLGY